MKKHIELVARNIKKNTTLKANTIYVIDAEVHVAPGVTLTIQDQTTILITNGLKEKSKVRRSALIFDQGSTLVAKRLYIKAADENYKAVKHCDNGGCLVSGQLSGCNKRHSLCCSQSPKTFVIL
jgi:hypothetical protein